VKDLHNFRINGTCQYFPHRSLCGQYYLVLLHFIEGNEVVRRVRKIAKSNYLASSCLSVRLPIRIEQLGSHWRDFHEIRHLSTFPKSAEKIQDSLKYDTSNGNFTWRLMNIYGSISLLELEKFQKKSCGENQNTYFTFKDLLRKSWHLWGNVEKCGRSRHATIWRMRFACRVTKATDAPSDYVILFFYEATMVKRTQLSIDSYVHYFSCFVMP
jgi:hypothetical protein